jgi:energy-coupling factor transporter ATP-binding protein EcfA2
VLSLVGALIAPTSLLVLDEPTAGLDPVRCAGLAAVVGEMARRTAVLVASQDEAWLGLLGATRHRLAPPAGDPAASASKKTD